MRPGGRASALIEILTLVQAEWSPKGAPADRVLARYLRERRFIGGGDRRWISDALYAILRDWRRYATLADDCGLQPTPRSALMLWLTELDEDLQPYFSDDQAYSPGAISVAERESIKSVNFNNHNVLSIIVNVPDELFDLLDARFGDETRAELLALKELAPLDIRMNGLNADAEPPKEGSPWQPHLMAVDGFRSLGFPRLLQLDSFKAGHFEIQDEASQICAALVDARPGMTVIDHCCGAGGKSLAIAAAMQNEGTLIASDTNRRRLDQLDQRASRAGVRIIESDLLPGHKEKRLDQIAKRHGMADRVLVDAPCSGSGTWRRNPGQRWHYGPKDIQDFHRLQLEILQEAAPCVKPGGKLIYATCSLFLEENERTVDAFLAQNSDFKAVPISQQWENSKLKPLIQPTWSTDQNYLQLTPARHDTDGFFVAVMTRN